MRKNSNYLKLFSLVFLFLAVLSLISIKAYAATMTDWEAYKRFGDKNVKWDSFVETGFEAFDAGKLGTAEMFLQRAVARGCEDGLVYAKIGLFYELQKNYKKAALFFKKAAARLHNQYPGLDLSQSIDEYMGRVLFLDGKRDDALAYLERSLAYGEKYTVLYLIGQIYKSKGEIETAIDYFKRALNAPHTDQSQDQVDILLMIELGKYNFDKQNFDASLEWWNKILKIDPANQVANSYKSAIDQQRYKEHERKVIEEIVK